MAFPPNFPSKDSTLTPGNPGQGHRTEQAGGSQEKLPLVQRVLLRVLPDQMDGWSDPQPCGTRGEQQESYSPFCPVGRTGRSGRTEKAGSRMTALPHLWRRLEAGSGKRSLRKKRDAELAEDSGDNRMKKVRIRGEKGK